MEWDPAWEECLTKYLKALRELIGSYAFPKMRAATKTSAPPPTT